MKERLTKFGREPDDIKVMPGLVPIIGSSQQEADDKFEKLQSLVHPEVGLQLLGEMLGSIDLSGYPLDGPLPEITTTIGSHTALKLFTEMAKRENLTIRQLYLRAVLRGHNVVRGTAAEDRGPYRGVVHGRRRRRLQRHAAVPSRRAR